MSNYDFSLEDECILLCKQLPWEMKERERNLTESEFEDICQRYIKELGLLCHSSDYDEYDDEYDEESEGEFPLYVF